ncbi:hypothetical protein [Bradyrhizobium sp. 160]|nr:hypothetical protein [Bradyrhizobium sp. 160]
MSLLREDKPRFANSCISMVYEFYVTVEPDDRIRSDIVWRNIRCSISS